MLNSPTAFADSMILQSSFLYRVETVTRTTGTLWRYAARLAQRLTAEGSIQSHQ